MASEVIWRPPQPQSPPIRSNMHMDTRVNEFADFKYDVKFDLWGYWGCLEAAMASEAGQKAVRGNMHINTTVIKDSDFKSLVKFELWGYWGPLKAIMVSDSTLMTIIYINMAPYYKSWNIISLFLTDLVDAGLLRWRYFWVMRKCVPLRRQGQHNKKREISRNSLPINLHFWA